MPAKQELDIDGTPKPRPRRQQPVKPVDDLKPTADELAKLLPDDPQAGLKFLAHHVDEMRVSIGSMNDEVMRELGKISSHQQATNIVKSAEPERKALEALTAKVEALSKSVGELNQNVGWLLTVFGSFSTLVSEADRSTRARFNLMVRVAERVLARHDKKPPKPKPDRKQYALLAVGGVLAIIGLWSMIGWVFE